MNSPSPYVLIYFKIAQDKDGANFSGPFIGGFKPTEALAKAKGTEIIEENPSMTIVTKVYRTQRGFTVNHAMGRAQAYFDRLQQNITESIEIQQRAVARRRRRAAR